MPKKTMKEEAAEQGTRPIMDETAWWEDAEPTTASTRAKDEAVDESEPPADAKPQEMSEEEEVPWYAADPRVRGA